MYPLWSAATRQRIGLKLLMLCLALVVAGTGMAGASTPDENLLRDLRPSRVEQVRRASELTDGRVAKEGSAWKTTAAAIFDGLNAYVEYDLGRSEVIGAVYLQGDNNDRYAVLGSEDGKTFQELWVCADGSR